MVSKDWREKIGGYRFDGSAEKKLAIHLELDSLEVNSNVEIQVYVIGLQIATIDPTGDVTLSLQ